MCILVFKVYLGVKQVYWGVLHAFGCFKYIGGVLRVFWCLKRICCFFKCIWVFKTIWVFQVYFGV